MKYGVPLIDWCWSPSVPSGPIRLEHPKSASLATPNSFTNTFPPCSEYPMKISYKATPVQSHSHSPQSSITTCAYPFVSTNSHIHSTRTLMSL